MDITDLARIDADTVLDRYLGSRFPIDSVALAVTMGMESYWMNNTDLASIATKKPDGTRIVGTNQYESTSRQRFACAHAIGHHMKQYARQLPTTTSSIVTNSISTTGSHRTNSMPTHSPPTSSCHLMFSKTSHGTTTPKTSQNSSTSP